jgi:hypothetical protein
MKNLFVLGLAIVSTTLISLQSAKADLPKVECASWPNQNSNVRFDIQRGFGSSWQDASLTFVQANQVFKKDYVVLLTDGLGWNQLRYWGAGVELEVDLGFDSSPQIFRTYDSVLTASDFNQGKPVTVRCEFLAF